MKYLKGTITISSLSAIIGLIGMIGVPFIYIENIKANTAKADAILDKAVSINSTNIVNLEKKIDEVNAGVKDIKNYLNIK